MKFPLSLLGGKFQVSRSPTVFCFNTNAWSLIVEFLLNGNQIYRYLLISNWPRQILANLCNSILIARNPRSPPWKITFVVFIWWVLTRLERLAINSILICFNFLSDDVGFTRFSNKQIVSDQKVAANNTQSDTINLVVQVTMFVSSNFDRDSDFQQQKQ